MNFLGSFMQASGGGQSYAGQPFTGTPDKNAYSQTPQGAPPPSPFGGIAGFALQQILPGQTGRMAGAVLADGRIDASDALRVGGVMMGGTAGHVLADGRLDGSDIGRGVGGMAANAMGMPSSTGAMIGGMMGGRNNQQHSNTRSNHHHQQSDNSNNSNDRQGLGPGAKVGLGVLGGAALIGIPLALNKYWQPSFGGQQPTQEQYATPLQRPRTGYEAQNPNIQGQLMQENQEDEKTRKRREECQASLRGVGEQPGVEIFRIEQFKLVPWPKQYYGCFFDGDCYLVLNTTVNQNGGLKWDVHYWIGTKASQDEFESASFSAVVLDDMKGGAPIQFRETQFNESPEFKNIFSGKVVYWAGGVD